MRGFCRENIARYKVPHYVDFVEECPMTASGKIQKYKLREAAVERYDLKAAAGVDTAQESCPAVALLGVPKYLQADIGPRRLPVTAGHAQRLA